jgi:hypothetical protein
MKWFTQFIDYSFHRLHKENDIERLYNIVNVEVLFKTWHEVVYEYKITDRKILRIFERDIDDFIFKMDFFTFLGFSDYVQEHLIEKYLYNTEGFEERRRNHYKTLYRRFFIFDLVIRLFR